jgi:hypothetical protein
VRFPSDTDTIYATFDYGNFGANSEFAFNWYHNGFRIYNDLVVWTFGAQGNTWVNLYDEEGLDDGFYEVEISLDGARLHRSGVTVGEATQNTQGGGFGAITFAEGVTDAGEPINPGTVFSELEEIYAFFDVNTMTNGTTWTRRWSLDGEVVSTQESVWSEGDIDYTWVSLYSTDGLPAGRYQLELLVEGQVAQSASMEIVESQSTTPVVRDVIVNGTVVTADNRQRPIRGVNVYFLVPGVLVDDFLDDPLDEDIYAYGVTDPEGFYQLDQNLTPGEFYGVVAYKEGYRVVAVDDYQIDPAATSPWVIDVTMERR